MQQLNINKKSQILKAEESTEVSLINSQLSKMLATLTF